MKIITHFTVLALCILAMFSCSKRYVGRDINANNFYWCYNYTLPHSFHLNTEKEGCIINATISKGAAAGSYIANGEIDFAQGSFGSLGIFASNEAEFTILLAKDGKIIDRLSFQLNIFGIRKKVPFSVEFECPGGFDAVTYIGEVVII